MTKKKMLTNAERVMRSRLKHNHVQVLFKKEHRAQIRLIASKQNKSFVQFIDDEMEKLIQSAKRQYGRDFAVLLDQARDSTLAPGDVDAIELYDSPPIHKANTKRAS